MSQKPGNLASSSNQDLIISFEFFPPKNEAGDAKFREALSRLSALDPQFVSITCGAGGSAIGGTASVVAHVKRTFGIEAVPHIAIARQRRSHLREALKAYIAEGVRQVVAIRGDDTEGGDVPLDDLYPNTVDFVAELKHQFGIDPIVAAYPEVHPRALSAQQDIDHLKRKQDAGAALAVSQFFFHAETFLKFRDKLRTAGIHLPLAAGIMPIHNFTQVARFAEGCGTKIPQGFGDRFARHEGDEEASFEEGVAHAAELCDHLKREGVHHFHFYTLNRSEMTAAVAEILGLTAAPSFKAVDQK